MKTKSVFIAVQIVAFWAFTTINGFSQACVTGSELIPNGGFEGALPATNLSTLGFTSSLSTTNAYPKCNAGAPVITDDASCGYKNFEPAAGTPAGGNNALLFDAGGSTVVNLVCTVVATTVNTTYDISAFYQCAAITSVSAGNIANMAITVNGVQVPGTVASVSNQGSFAQSSCFYKATSASSTVCIQLQPTDLVSPGNWGGGNDVIVDNFSMKATTGGGACTSGSCTYPVSAPVTLISFTAKRIGENDLNLEWVTASEENFAYFSVEKSENGKDFVEVAQIPGRGGTTLTNYEFHDSDFTKPYYYRLKIIDKDGKYKYSKIIFVPKYLDYVSVVNTGDEIKIIGGVRENTTWNISFYSLLGQEYLNENISLSKGENIIPFKNIQLIDKNPKILRIVDDDGRVIYSKVFVFKTY